MPTAQTDIELWNAFMAGDKEAFSTLFRRFYPLLFQYGRKITTDTQVLEDAIQELFLELWQKPTTQSLISVKAYLLQALKFKLYKTFRQKPFLPAGEENNEIGFELSTETLLVNKEENDEQLLKIAAALEQLSPRQKEVIYLKIYKGLSYEEVSEIMGLNYQVVRNLLYTALKAFRKLCTMVAMSLIFLNA
ncbi:MAG TPA: sigma-70 family RNA polymerase sigma factor [Flavisolibacter sp.]